MFQRFLRIYVAQGNGTAFATPEALLRHVGLFHLTQRSLRNQLAVRFKECPRDVRHMFVHTCTTCASVPLTIAVLASSFGKDPFVVVATADAVLLAILSATLDMFSGMHSLCRRWMCMLPQKSMGTDESSYRFGSEFVAAVNRVNYNQDNGINALAGES